MFMERPRDHWKRLRTAAVGVFLDRRLVDAAAPAAVGPQRM
jgi:hypothetical protein